MPGSVLVARIDRGQRRIELDGAVRPGDRADDETGREVLVLGVASMGHLVDRAQVLATALRASGWVVTVRRYEHRAVPHVRTGQDSARAIVAVIEASTGKTTRPAATTKRRPIRTWTMRRYRCDECGIETVTAAMTMHQRRTGHAGRTFLESVVIDKTTKGVQEPEIDHPDAEIPPEWDNPSERDEGENGT